MKLWVLYISMLLVGMVALSDEAAAGCLVEADTTYSAGTMLRNPVCDTSGAQKAVVRGFSSSGPKTADALVKSGAGILHTLTCASDAAATAGTLIVYDNTAESGTQILNITFGTGFYPPATMILDVEFATGLYLGFTTTADVTCTAAYR